MTKQEILFALDVTHPGGAPILAGAAWETLEELRQCWIGATALPTLAEMEVALTGHYAAQSLTTVRAAIRTALRAKWDALPAWIRGPFQDKFAVANTLLDAGQDDAAEAIIQYAEVPTAYSVEQVAIFAVVRAELLAALSGIPPVS